MSHEKSHEHGHGHVKYFGGWKLTVGIAFILTIVFAVAFIPALPVVQQGDPVKIPVLLPLSGEFEDVGLELKSGIELAFENTDGRYVPVYFDTEGNPAKAVNYARSLYNDGYKMVLGPALSDEASALAPYAEMLGFLVLSPTATAEDLTNYPNYVFRIVSSDKYTGNGIVTILSDVESIKNVTVLWSMDDFGNSQYNAFVEAVKERQTSEHEGLSFTPTYIPITSDLSDIVDEVRASNPDAFYIIAENPGETNRVLDMIHDDISETVFRVTADTGYSSVVAENPNADGLYLIIPEKETNDPYFVWMYENKYGVPPSSVDVYYGYDAANLLIMAMDNSEDNNPTEVADILKSTRYLGVTGAICFDENADRYPVYTVMQLQNGEWISLPWSDVFSFNMGKHR
ncbi:MAG TPA: branched-chain amino acid ABC transporter substrate-binding protein [Methanocorpusculum sp.]|nr:branched-chain amino acid ABC transporter substrate-binding protein [Methanocorpusculum sp.]